MDPDQVKKLKTHLETLEKVRALEKDVKDRLRGEGLLPEEQIKWAGVLKEAGKTLLDLEGELESQLQSVRTATPGPVGGQRKKTT